MKKSKQLPTFQWTFPSGSPRKRPLLQLPPSSHLRRNLIWDSLFFLNRNMTSIDHISVLESESETSAPFLLSSSTTASCWSPATVLPENLRYFDIFVVEIVCIVTSNKPAGTWSPRRSAATSTPTSSASATCCNLLCKVGQSFWYVLNIFPIYILNMFPISYIYPAYISYVYVLNPSQRAWYDHLEGTEGKKKCDSQYHTSSHFSASQSEIYCLLCISC